MPTFLFIKGGEVVDRLTGANSDRLKEVRICILCYSMLKFVHILCYVHVSNIGLLYNSLLKSGLSKVRRMLD